MTHSRSILVVLAHPDDESFPIGGTLARYSVEGTRIVLVSATRGEAGIPGLTAERVGQIREGELLAASQILGLAEVRFLGYMDGELAHADRDEVIACLVEAVNEIRPPVVITFGPDGISGHADHVAISALTTAAFDCANLPAALFYVSPSNATFQACGVVASQTVTDRPIAAIDVSQYLVQKVRAMQCHASQHQPCPGMPEEEAARLACHEYFSIARPESWRGDVTDLFEVL